MLIPVMTIHSRERLASDLFAARRLAFTWSAVHGHRAGNDKQAAIHQSRAAYASCCASNDEHC